MPRKKKQEEAGKEGAEAGEGLSHLSEEIFTRFAFQPAASSKKSSSSSSSSSPPVGRKRATGKKRKSADASSLHLVVEEEEEEEKEEKEEEQLQPAIADNKTQEKGASPTKRAKLAGSLAHAPCPDPCGVANLDCNGEDGDDEEDLCWEEVTLDHKPSGSADELEDGGEEEEQEDEDEEEKGVDDSSDDDAFLNGTEALPEKKSSPPKPGKGVAAFDQVLNDDLKNLITKGNKKRKRQTKVKVEQSSRKQQAEKRKRKSQQKMALEIHQAHLLCFLAHHSHINKRLEDSQLQSTLFSMVPLDLWPTDLTVEQIREFKKRLRQLLKWFRNTFEIKNASTSREEEEEEEEEGALRGSESKSATAWREEAERTHFDLIPDELLQVIEQKRGSPKQLAQLLVSLCRALRLSTRYVAVLDPVTFKLPTTRKSPAKSQERKSLLATEEANPKRRGKKQTSPQEKATTSAQAGAEASVLTLPQFVHSTKSDYDDKDTSSASISTTSLQPEGKAKTTPSPKAARGRRKSRLSPSPSPRSTPATPLTSPSSSSKHGRSFIPQDMPTVWAEIYSPLETKWIHVDVIRNVVDHPHYYEETYLSLQLSYVVSFAEGSLSVRDVTRRYVSRWSEVIQRRMPEPDWWNQTLAIISQPTNRMRDQNADDDAEQNERELTEKMPTTLSAFKTHPLYCLERFIHKYEALYPKGPVLGEFKGQPIYPRSCVRKLHTRDKWLQKAREVKEGEVPIKRVRKLIKKKKRINDEADAMEDQASQSFFSDEREESPSEERKKGKGKEKEQDDENFVDLFGKWQTEEYVPRMALNGIVPKNEFGNVYLFKPSMLPVGTVHVKYPNALTIAKRINVDCAATMVGWRWASARSVPEIEGIIVCEEYAGLIEEVKSSLFSCS